MALKKKKTKKTDKQFFLDEFEINMLFLTGIVYKNFSGTQK